MMGSMHQIDQQSNYLVFIAPEGDSSVLFVSQKSGSGFAVTESRGGRDSIAFQYRSQALGRERTAISAPYDSHATSIAGQ
jgi:hypothetical protein